MLRPWWNSANVFLDLKAVYVHLCNEDAQISQRIIRVLEELKDPETGSAVNKKAWCASSTA